VTSIHYSFAMYCPECDLIYTNDHNECPSCCNKNGLSMNSIRNIAVKKIEELNVLIEAERMERRMKIG
jgi:hypothetical protein